MFNISMLLSRLTEVTANRTFPSATRAIFDYRINLTRFSLYCRNYLNQLEPKLKRTFRDAAFTQHSQKICFQDTFRYFLMFEFLFAVSFRQYRFKRKLYTNVDIKKISCLHKELFNTFSSCHSSLML